MKNILFMLQKAGKVIQTLQSVAKKMNWPIMPTVGGSISLFIEYGAFRKPHDIDIIVHAKDIGRTQMLVKMALEYASNWTWWSNYYYNDMSYFLKVDDVIVNIIIRDDIDLYDYDLGAYTINGVDIAFENVSTIIDYKASYGREKDLQDLMFIEEIKNLKKKYGYEKD